ncbi:D-glycero-D-manno-heptose-7-phosphate 1-kinase [Granulibacter bethesdensis]|nr:D-glycero-D-manno-heptose-7-phosphate 1-kinase [Granulibacter bethesdensis]
MPYEKAARLIFQAGRFLFVFSLAGPAREKTVFHTSGIFMDFSSTRVLCIGDVMLDRFMHGSVERISPEAPVPVLRITSTHSMLGGAGNVAHNIADLGGTAILVGLIGHDDTAIALRTHLDRVPGIVNALVESPHRPTICKTRFLAAQQQVVRTDDESHLPTQPAEETLLQTMVATHITECGAVILSDYGKGVLSPAVIKHAIGLARQAGIPVFVDPKRLDFSVYAGATCITPNVKELSAAAHQRADDEASVIAAARIVMQQAGCASILATRSEKGMMLIEAPSDGRDDIAIHTVPARAREVFDVSGAGDTVIATLALAHASGLTLESAMRISNAAAGVVVSKAGTATLNVDELRAELDESAISNGGTGSARSLGEARSLVKKWKQLGLTVGFTNGCFDILHAGHVSLLNEARTRCDRLVVAVNTDASVSRLKGPTRPINGFEDRCTVLAGLRSVDCVVGFQEDTPLSLISVLLPDRLFKGADYREEEVVGGDVVRAAGGKVELIDLVPGRSTTGIVKKISTSL